LRDENYGNIGASISEAILTLFNFLCSGKSLRSDVRARPLGFSSNQRTMITVVSVKQPCNSGKCPIPFFPRLTSKQPKFYFSMLPPPNFRSYANAKKKNDTIRANGKDGQTAEDHGGDWEEIVDPKTGTHYFYSKPDSYK